MMSAMSTSSSTTRMFMMGTSLFFGCPGQLDHKARAARHALFYSHRSSMQVDQRLDNRQPQATARLAALPGIAAAIKLVEDDIALRLGHARPIVGHRQRD